MKENQQSSSIVISYVQRIAASKRQLGTSYWITARVDSEVESSRSESPPVSNQREPRRIHMGALSTKRKPA